MATGDLKNNVKKLQSQLKAVKYAGKLDLDGLRDGSPTAFLPLFHHVFTSYSHRLNKDISNSNNELYGKSDLRFIEAVYKILRDMFSYKPPVTREQFFQPGFAERKVIMATEILRQVHSVYTPQISSSSYKLATKMDKKVPDVQTKVQGSASDSHKGPAKTRKVAGKPVADLTEAIVLPRYMTSSMGSHDWSESQTTTSPPNSHRPDAEIRRHISNQPRQSPREEDDDNDGGGGDVTDNVTTQFTQHITNALSMLNTQVGKISTALEKVETQIASNENPRQPRQPVTTATASNADIAKTDRLQLDTLVSKMVLLENRMTLLESKVDDIQSFCAILLQDKATTTNNINSRDTEVMQNDHHHNPSIPITSCTSETNINNDNTPQVERNNRGDNSMHPDYIKAFAPVGDNVRTTSDKPDRIGRPTADVDDDCDADDDVTVEDAVAADGNRVISLGGPLGGQIGHMNFMKALIANNGDSEVSLSRDQDDSVLSSSLQQPQHTRTLTRTIDRTTPHSQSSTEPSLQHQPHPASASFGTAFSPIRDQGHGHNPYLHQNADQSTDDVVHHIPYGGMEDQGFESRRLSSTPNKTKQDVDLDTSTLSRVNRIMQMMKETQEHIQQHS